MRLMLEIISFVLNSFRTMNEFGFPKLKASNNNLRIFFSRID